MSTEERLARLGLLHLQNDPPALQRALEQGRDRYDREVDVWNASRGAIPAEQVLYTDPSVRHAFGDAYPRASWTAVYALIGERLRGHGLTVTASDSNVAVHDAADFAEVARIASERPYPYQGGHLFVPMAVGGVSPVHNAFTLDWRGDLASSTLGWRRNGETLDGVVRFEKSDDHEVTLTRLGAFRTGLRAPTEPIKTMAPLALVTPNRTTLVFPHPSSLVTFAASGGAFASSEYPWFDGWQVVALDRLAFGGTRYAVTLVFSAEATDDWLAPLAALSERPATPTTRIARVGNAISIVAEGAHDELVVYGDMVCEHLAERTVSIRSAIAAEGELPEDLLVRLKIE